MAAAAALPPYPDAADALARLRVAGHTPSAVTNSAADAARAALGAAGLLEHMHAVVGADAAGAYKPDPRVYRNAIDVLGLDAGRDVVRRRATGGTSPAPSAPACGPPGSARDEGVLLATAPEPDITAADLKEAAEAIARRLAARAASRPSTPRPGSR